MNRHYSLRLFGRPALIGPDGAAVRFRTRKHLALLIYLHLEARQHGVARELLIDLLWPGTPRAAGGHSLSQALTVLRGHLGSGFVSRGGDAVQLVQPVETDFDQLESGTLVAPDLTAPLADFDDCGGTEFAHWVDAARARVARMAADVLRDQLGAARTQGEVAHVHERAGLLYAVDPLSDAAVQALAERHLLAQDAVGAIRLLREHSNRVRRELNCDPHPELRRLAARLESGERPRRPSPPIEQSPEAPRRPQVFIGREREIARLEALWAQVRAGRLLTCLITGAPGMGKSSLIERFAASVVARTWSAVTVTCQEIGRDIPFAVVADLLYALGRDPQTSGADPEWLGEASRLAPGLRARYPGIPRPPSVPPEAVKLRAAEAIVHVLGVVGDGGPLLLALDNFHHIDPVSAEILHLVLRRLEQSPVFIVGTARSPHELTPVSGQPAESITWRVHEPLAPLSRGQTSALVHALTRDETPVMPRDIQEKIAELSQGIPYLVEMLVADWFESGEGSLATAELIGRGALQRWQPPEMLRRAFARQYAGLDDSAQQVVSLLAVADRPLQPEEITTLLQLPAPETHRVNLQLMRQGIVRVAEAGVTFKNELHRAFVYHATDDDTQRYLHRLIAGRLDAPKRETAGAGTTELERSHHLARSGDVGAAVASALEGARAALERGAFQEVERALLPLVDVAAPVERTRVALLLAEAECNEGKFAEAANRLVTISTDGLSNEDRVALVRIRAEASHRGRLAPDAQIRAWAGEYLSAARGFGETEEILRAIQLKLEVATDDGELATIEELRQAAQASARNVTTPGVKAKALMTEGYCRLLLDEPLHAASMFSEAASLFRALNSTSDLLRCLRGIALGYARAGDHDAAKLLYENLIGTATDVGDADTLVNALSNLAVSSHQGADMSAAADAYLKALELLDERGNPRRAALVYTNAAHFMIAHQELSAADALIDVGRKAADRAQWWQLSLNCQLAKADAIMAGGDVEAALSAFEVVEKLRAGRSLFWLDASYERMKRHYLWASDGYQAMLRYAESAPVRKSVKSVMPFEVSLFEEWVARIVHGRWRDSAMHRVTQAINEGSPGVLVNLLALGVGLATIESQVPREPYAAMNAVASRYPNLVRPTSRDVMDQLKRMASP